MTTSADLAQLAVTLGAGVRAQKLFAELPDYRQVTADANGVLVRQMPRDFAFSEHGAYGDNPRDLLDVPTAPLLSNTTQVELFAGVERFMRESGADFLRINFEDGTELTSHRAEAVLRRPVSQPRFFGWGRKTSMVPAQRQPIFP